MNCKADGSPETMFQRENFIKKYKNDLNIVRNSSKLRSELSNIIKNFPTSHFLNKVDPSQNSKIATKLFRRFYTARTIFSYDHGVHEIFFNFFQKMFTKYLKLNFTIFWN